MIRRNVPQVWLRTISLAMLAVLLIVSLPGTTQAQDDRIAPRELESFVDPIIEDQMAEYSLPGVAFVLVQDGEIVLSKGYGVMEDGSDEPIDPEQTIFDLGSVAKLFTATAVMQQVEQGNLDLDTDVREYLSDVEIPDTYDEPITLRHLMTHTPGFDERMFLGMIAPGPDEIQPLNENLNEHMPPRIRPPGETMQYSNTGMAIAGRIIEEVSGESFSEYIENHIFDPLGMERSTFDYPDELIPDMATGHEATAGPTMPMEVWHLNDRPAGGIRSTIEDIARFMNAHLDEGGAILEPETTEEMHQTQFRLHEGVSGSAIGFIEHEVGNRRGIHHGGQWIGFSSLLYLLPEEDTGILVSANHGSAIYTQYVLIEAILDEYFPADVDVEPGEQAEGSVAGTYRWNRVDRHTFMQLMSTVTAHTLDVTENDDGTITTQMSPELIPEKTWVEISPGLYQEQGGDDRLGFDFNESGEATTVHLAWPLLMTLDRISWYQSSTLYLGLLGVFLVTLATTAGWPIMRLVRRVRGRRTELAPEIARTRLLAGTVAGLIFVSLIGTLVLVATDTVGFFQIPVTFKALLWLPIIAAILTIPLVVLVARLWARGEGEPARRVHLTLIAVAMVGLVPYLWYWGLLGWNY
jgi:CubicO group peptidase (beta-lactamase class C family)